MANMPKRGLDYFSHSVKEIRSRKVALLIKNHGPASYVAYEGLLETIYESGSYLFFEDEEELIYTIEMMTLVSTEEAEKILRALINANFFDYMAYKKGFLTSKEIQKQYYFATKERKNRVTKECWLLTDDEMNEIDAGIKYKKIMGGENKIVPTYNPNDIDDNEQSNSNRESKSKRNRENDKLDEKDSGSSLTLEEIESLDLPFKPTYYFKYFIAQRIITGYEDYAYYLNAYLKALYDEYDNELVNKALVKVTNRLKEYKDIDSEGRPIEDKFNYIKTSIEDQIHKERCYDSGKSPFDEGYGVF